ncbi:hypothetical protein HZS_3495 [Henneguya salminicola]|nr:hypothetical protein HZS_3495 [Henneguya salminicola]
MKNKGVVIYTLESLIIEKRLFIILNNVSGPYLILKISNPSTEPQKFDISTYHALFLFNEYSLNSHSMI